MSIKQLESPLFRAVYGSGSTTGTPGTALASGRVFVTNDGGTYSTAADRATVYSDKAKTTPSTRDSDGAIALDTAGEVEIWFDGTVDIRVEDSAEVLQYTLTGIESSSGSAAAGGESSLIQNYSFETDTDNDGAPDNWTLASEVSATIAIDATSGGQSHGVNGLKFTGSGSGGGTATSTIFDVKAGDEIQVGWDFKQADAPTGTYVVDVEWYQYDGNASATSEEEVWSITSAAPTAWTGYSFAETVPADATQAKVRLTGLENGGADETGSCWFDNVYAVDNKYVTLDTAQTVNNKTIGTGFGGGATISETVQASTSGTDIDFASIPAWVKSITVMLSGVSTNGITGLIVRIGDSGGFETTGYVSTNGDINTGTITLSSAGFAFVPASIAGYLYTGKMVLDLLDSSTNTWIANGTILTTNTIPEELTCMAGSKSLSATLDSVRVTAIGADTFTAGKINILYEG